MIKIKKIRSFGPDWHSTSNEPGHGHHRLKAFSNEVDWFEGEHRCRLFGGHLPSAHSVAKNDKMRTELQCNSYYPRKTKSKPCGCAKPVISWLI